MHGTEGLLTQSDCLAVRGKGMLERETGIEPATFSLGS